MTYATTNRLLTPFQELQAQTLGRFLALAYLAQVGNITDKDYVLEQMKLIRQEYLKKDRALNEE